MSLIAEQSGETSLEKTNLLLSNQPIARGHSSENLVQKRQLQWLPEAGEGKRAG